MRRMKKLRFTLGNYMAAISLILVSLVACNDGDVIVTSFDFEDATLQSCGGPGAYVFFKINSSAAESISLQLGTTSELFVATDTLVTELDGSSNIVNYRVFNGEVTSSYFCSAIPPTSPEVSSEFIASSGTSTLFTTTTLDDEDGLAFVNSNDSLVEGTGDFDGDGIPNFYDFDDDGDNVPTSVEIGSDPEDPRDSDDDGIPDWRDPDDDNDGILTRYEDVDEDLNPANNVTNPGIGPDYLNPAVTDFVVIDLYREHSYQLSSDIRVVLNNLVLINGEEQIIQETLDLGTQTGVLTGTVTTTPDF